MNEEKNIPRCYDEITCVMEPLGQNEQGAGDTKGSSGAQGGCDYEVLVIDNDSKDCTGVLAKEICARDLRWRYIKFSRNFTVEVSMAAGLRYARGDAVVILFSDLQEPPDVIPRFIEKWREGYDIVYGVHTKREGDGALMRFSVACYYKLLRWMSDQNLPEHAGDFRLMDRRVVNVLNHMREKNRYLRGLSYWVGFRSCPVHYERRPRLAGKSNAPGLYLILMALRTICNFSIKPLQMFLLFGIFVMAVVALLIVGLIVHRLLFPSASPGLTTTHILLLLNLGVMSLGFGILGEYIGHTYTETKRRPLWIVDETANLPLSEEEKIGL